MATDQEIVVQLNMLYRSELAAGMKADQLVMAETQAQLRGVGIASTQAAAGEKALATESKASAAGMGEMGAASRLASGNMDLLGVAALGARGNLALLGVAAAAYAVTQGAALQSSLTETRNNTTMTTAQFGQMRAEILRLGAQSPISLDKLAAGYRQISDTGFQGAAANKLMEVSMKSAASTGADFAQVAATLSTVMHAMGASANEAAHYQDVLHLAANEGRLTLQDMSQVFGVVSTYASEAGISVEDAAAAISTMTRNGLDAATSATQFRDAVTHIINPSKQARDEIALLSKQTGVDLVHDFSQAGLSAKGLFGVMGDVKTATNGNVQEMAKLIPAMRGMLLEMILTGKGARDYATILGQLKDAHGQTDEAYKRSQQTLNFYLGTLHNQLVITAADWGEKALPAIQAYVHFVESYAIPEFKLLAWSITGVADKVAGGADKVNNFGQALGHWGDAVNSVIPVTDALTGSYDHLHGSLAPLVAEQERERLVVIADTKAIEGQTQALSHLAQAKHDAFTTSAYSQFGPAGRPGYGPGGDATMYSTFPGVRALDQTSQKAAASVSLHSAKVDMLTAAQDVYQKALNAGYADLAAGHPITAAHVAAIKADKDKVDDMTAAINAIINPIHAFGHETQLASGLMSGLSAGIKGVLDTIRVRTPKGYGNQYLDTSIPYGVTAGQQAEPGANYVKPGYNPPAPVTTPTGDYYPGAGLSTSLPAGVIAGAAAEAAAQAALLVVQGLPVSGIQAAALAGGAAGTPGGGTNVGGMGILEPTAPPAPGTPIDRNALVAAFGPLVSQFQSAMLSSNAVNAAHLQVLQQEGAQQVQLLSTQVTLTQDLTGEISALSSLQQAQGQGAITAINDQTTIFQAISAGQVQAIKDNATISADIASGNTAKLAQDSQIASIDQALARDQIGIAQEQAAIDRSASQTAILLAADNLKVAQDKTLVDSANAQAQAKLMGAQLLVAQDNERLVIDGNKLSYDMLQTLVSIDQSLPGVKDFGSMLHDDMAAMSRDNAALLSDQGLVGQLTNAANLLAQNGQQQLAYDAQQTAIDAANGASQKLGLELTLAGLKQQEARDQSMLNVLQAQLTVAQQTLAATQQTNAALIDYARTLEEQNRNLRDPGIHQITVLPSLPGSNHPVAARALLSSR